MTNHGYKYPAGRVRDPEAGEDLGDTPPPLMAPPNKPASSMQKLAKHLPTHNRDHSPYKETPRGRPATGRNRRHPRPQERGATCILDPFQHRQTAGVADRRHPRRKP